MANFMNSLNVKKKILAWAKNKIHVSNLTSNIPSHILTTSHTHRHVHF